MSLFDGRSLPTVWGIGVVLVERECGLAAIENMVKGSRGTGSRGLVITGGIATGKTTLLRAYVDRAREAGALSLYGVASRVERHVPFGVLEQLFHSPDLPQAGAAGAANWLDQAARSLSGRGTAPAGQVPASVLRGLWQLLRDLLDQRPLVIAVGDMQHADEPSLRCLLYLVRRLRSERLHVVFTEGTGLDAANTLLRSEFLREPSFRQIRLAPLSKAGVVQMLAAHLDEQAAHDLAPAFHEASAGYPMLVRALIDDLCGGGPQVFPEGGEAGESFRRAVQRLLLQYDPPVIEFARAIALLGRPVPPSVLGRLLGTDVGTAHQAVAALTLAEILVDGRFRHRMFQNAVLGGSPTARRALHRRMAQLLHNEGAPARDVADHIVAAERLEEPWAVPILREAAEHALAHDEVGTGIDYLRVAYEICEERQRPRIVSMLVDAEWRVDPATVLRRLHEFDTSGAGESCGARLNAALNTTTPYLLWHGRLEEAADLTGGPPAGGETAESLGGLATSRLWAAYLYPGVFQTGPMECGTTEGGAIGGGAVEGGAVEGGAATCLEPDCVPVPLNPDLQSVGRLAMELAHGNEPSALADAEGILQRSRLNPRTLAPLTAALAVLVYNDRLDTASFWCDALLAEATERRSPTWHALLSAQRALISLRQGRLAEADGHAETALRLISAEGWGVAVGLPLAVRVLAATAMGDPARAKASLDVPVPEAMFRTRMGVHYLAARGRYHLATGRSHAALSDFFACGKLMRDWGIDLPAVEPWRSGAAEAYRSLGKPRKARALADEQAALLRPGHRRARALTLRSQAATRDPETRAARLREAVDLFQACGDRLGLAYAVMDLSRAVEALGDPVEARLLARRATALARECRAPVQAADAWSERPAPARPASQGLPPARIMAALSGAERKVAALAAAGHTNREISEKLSITISTVEQHLTRIYRKLKVKRFDLKSVLHHTDLEGLWLG
ncbi:helix-turn-helix transcriptional regulator [Actinomadura litoris]|uniref:helix-turn-helix transcriptional regulator n=1 Tax=Actinomadura litoris TaxID=2678616 RepID=UPI002342D24E|nr:LuxR family transcriptional regulator [Actinomadura litoris]